MLSFDSKRATITESETYAQGFLTSLENHPRCWCVADSA